MAITRRRLLHHGAALSGCAALGPWLAPSWASAAGLAERAIPSSGERLPVIGLGTSRTFNVAPGSAQFTPLLDVLQVSVDGGLKVIDTAPSYGQAEAVTGELVARSASRERVFLATKVSSTGREAGQRQIEASFRALQAERIDLIQVHNLQDTVTQLATLNALKQQGRIRYTGLTHYLDSAHDALIEALGKHKVDFVQFNYSVGSRSAEQRLLPFCAEHGIAVLINRAYQAGELFERVKGQPLPAWLGSELGITSWAQAMLKFVLANPAVTTVIPATSNPRYAADNLLAGHGPMPDAGQRERIAALFA